MAVMEPQVKVLYWLVPDNLYLFDILSGCVITNVNILPLCDGHSYEKLPRSSICATTEPDQVSLLGPMLSLHNGQN